MPITVTKIFNGDTMPCIITSLEQIREACEEKPSKMADFVILLGPKGELRSSKQIIYNGKDRKGQDIFEVFHSIDGSFITYKGDKLLTETNIGKAIELGRFYRE